MGETMGASLSTSRNFTFFQGNYVRVRRGGWTSPSLLPLTVGKWGFMQISQYFGSDQESLTSMQATSPAGHRQPGAGTIVTHTLTSLSLTPRLPGWGTERLQNREMVLPTQVCTKPHTPDDHRSGEGILHFKLFKRYSFFPGSSLSCPQYR